MVTHIVSLISRKLKGEFCLTKLVFSFAIFTSYSSSRFNGRFVFIPVRLNLVF